MVPQSSNLPVPPSVPPIPAPHNVQLSIGGMTCSACIGSIVDGVSGLEGVMSLTVNLIGKSAAAEVTHPDVAQRLAECIEDIGFECRVISVLSPPSRLSSDSSNFTSARALALEINGVQSIPSYIREAVDQLSVNLTVLNPLPNHPKNVLHLTYTPSPPEFTIRSITSAIRASSPSPITISVWHPPSTEDIAHQMHRREQLNLLFRLIITVLVAIPTFIIGIVYMTLVKVDNPGRRFLEEPLWAGNVTRGQWAMFILATPIMFYSAEIFHRKSFKEIWYLWRPRSQVPILSRFLKFGSMNLLISLGVSIAYFSSVADLAMAAKAVPHDPSMPSSNSMSYFDSVVFLSMFLLLGRYLEAYSKHQAANAVALLRGLRSSEALLVSGSTSDLICAKSEDEIEKGSFSVGSSIVEKVPTDLLEVGDIVRIPPGATPPADGTVISTESTFFDESSLTGESKNVSKSLGDQVYVGTINKLRAIDVRVDAIGGQTMLDKVIEVVRQGQTKRAPIERFADMITSRFVPVVTALAIITWITWLSLGLGGALPQDTISGTAGGWPVWSLGFAIAVFVIACPCGIGLAAPTALMVGSAVAAKNGILARGGGEAFQEASNIDVMVFDKTGTLTEGNEPKVTDAVFSSPSSIRDPDDARPKSDSDIPIAGIVLQLASASSHPLCTALLHYFEGKGRSGWEGSDVREIPGRGMQGTFKLEQPNGSSIELQALMGNEALLQEHGCAPSASEANFLYRMKTEGKSVVLLAICRQMNTISDAQNTASSSTLFSVAAVFAVADPIRVEAPAVVAQLHAQNIETWMISGDNEVTARAVARLVGIPQENVIAGVLPEQKAEKIQWLQTTPSVDGNSSKSKTRRVIAMVGDGINDAAALATADVGIAIGSGSDVALSSAKFILLSSNLRTLLTLTHFSKKVFNRIKFNFFWACVYNIIAVPIAAGVIYPAGHARLNPVWSALAMALSSTSVVCSSLLLRLYKPPMPIPSGSGKSRTSGPAIRDVEKGEL